MTAACTLLKPIAVTCPDFFCTKKPSLSTCLSVFLSEAFLSSISSGIFASSLHLFVFLTSFP
jgi:hypothetical protein